MELDSLKFVVDTTDLVKAVTEVGKLQTAVSNLNKPLAETARISAKAAKEAAAVAIAEGKAAVAVAKGEEAQNKANAAKARAEKAAERVTKSVTAQTSVLERQNAIYEFMTQGYSKGQATVMAQARAQGALADELTRVGSVLKDQRKLVGGDPFDKSTSGLISLRNAMVELRDEARTSTAGIEMTSKQYKEFARDKLRLIEISKAEGVSLSVLNQRLREHGAEFVSLTTEVNKLTNAEKERERSQRLQANAVRAISAEDEKMDSILRSLNAGQAEHVSVSDKAARSIANYERNLRLAGVSGEVAAAKLDKYRKSAMLAAQAEEKRKVSFLSRALAPQISDVVVSLAGGMNPMTVLLQQGLQVRDLIGLSGVAAKDLQVAFKSAASDMVGSIKGTAVALGSLLVGGLMDAGRATSNFAMSVTGLDTAFAGMRNRMLAMDGLMNKTPKSVRLLDTGLAALGATGALALGTLVIAAGLFAKGLYDVIKQENDLARAVNLTGASLGMNHNQIIALSGGMEGLGVSSAEAMKAFTVMAKEGGFTASELGIVTKAAVDLDKYAGVAIEETVKKFSKLKEKPVEALIELAKQTGLVSVETIKAVAELQKQGRATEAVAVAVRVMADVNSTQVQRMKEDYNDFALWMIEFAKTVKQSLSSIFQDLFRKASPTNALEQELNKINHSLNSWGIGDTFKKQLEDRKSAIEKEIAILTTEDQRRAASIAAQAKAATNYAETQQFIGQYTSKEVNKQKELAELERRKSQMSAENYAMVKKTIEEKYKVSNTPKSDAEKEGEKLEKISARYIKDFTHNIIGAESVVGDLTKSQQHLMEVLSSSEWSSLPDQAKILAAAYKAIAKEQINEAMKERVQLAKEEFQEFSKFLDLQEEFRKSQDDTKRSLEESSGLIAYEANLIAVLPEERAKLLKIKQVEFNLSKKLLEIDKLFLKNSSDWLSERAKAMTNAATEVQQINSTYSNDLKDKMVTDITDAITTGLFEGGKAGSQKLRSIIEAELMKPITIFIRAVVGDIIGGGSGGSSQNALSSLLDKGTSFVKNIMNFGSNLSSQLGTSALRIGDWLATSSNNTLAGAGEWLQGNYAGIGKIGGAFGNAMMGNALYKGLSNGYSISKGLDIVGNIASLFGPMYGAIGGFINRAFGRKLKDTGVEGTFSGEDSFDGNTYQFHKGGLFRSDKTKYGALDSTLKTGLGAAYGAVTANNKAMADYMGIDSETRLKDFKYKTKFSTQGMSEAKIKEKLTAVLTAAGEAQAKRLLGTMETVTTTKKTFWGDIKSTSQKWNPSEFVRSGETALEALTRLSSSLKVVNTFLDSTNVNLLEFSTAGADVASKLVDLFGGIDNFSSISSNYYQQFFSDQERTAKGHELLSNAFEELGIALPSTIAGYRQLVEGQNLTTESGRETFTALMTLSSAFYEIKTAAEAASSSIVEEINRLRGVIANSSDVGTLSALTTDFSIGLAQAKSGDLTALQNLPGLSQNLEQAAIRESNSTADLTRIRAWLANSLQGAVPAFASGGVHDGGIRLVGENGPELEVTGPSRIFNSGNTSNLLDNSNVVQAIVTLNSNLDGLRAEVRANVIHSAKTAKILDRVSQDGETLNTTVSNTIVVSGTIDGNN